MEERKLQPLMPQGTAETPVRWDRPYVASEDYIMRRVAGEAMLVSLAEDDVLGNSILSLNETFAFLWQLYSQPRTLAEVVALAWEEYEDPEGLLEGHIRSFLWQGVQLKLLVPAEMDE